MGLITLVFKVKNSISYRINKLFQKIIWKNLNLQWKLKSGLVVTVGSHAEWVIYNDIFVDGEYDVSIKTSLSEQSKDQSKKIFRLLDIGANVGYFTFQAVNWILAYNPDAEFQITVVEGSPTVYKSLESRIMAEPLLQGKVHLIHGLVGELQGEGKIVESDFHVMNTVIDQSLAGVSVSYVNLNLLYPDNWEIDLLKCDIEGSEQKFIENHRQLLKKVKYAVFEFHPSRCQVDKCYKMLREVGFLNSTKLRNEPSFEVHFFWK